MTNETRHRNNGCNRFGVESVCLYFGHNAGQKAEAVNTFFTPTPPDPLDVARDHAVDQKIEEADMKDRQLRAYLEAAVADKEHYNEARWLLLHVKDHLYPRFEENREWYERWQAWVAKEMAK